MSNPLAFMSISPGGGELLMICVAVLMLFGAKNVPKFARSFGKIIEEFRRASQDVREEILRAADEDEEASGPEAMEPTPDDRAQSRGESNEPSG